MSLSGSPTFRHKYRRNVLFEFDEAELRKLQAVCQRRRRADQNGAANPYPAVPETKRILVAMDGWTVSLVESYFALFKMLRGSHELHVLNGQVGEE